MAGQIRKLIDEIIQKRSAGSKTLENVIRTKLLLKGIDPYKYQANSEDTPDIVQKLRNFAQESNITLSI